MGPSIVKQQHGACQQRWGSLLISTLYSVICVVASMPLQAMGTLRCEITGVLDSMQLLQLQGRAILHQRNHVCEMYMFCSKFVLRSALYSCGIHG